MEEGFEIDAITVFETAEWNDLKQRELLAGADRVLQEILEKPMWSNAEMMWVLKHMLFYYGSKDALLKEAPIERIFDNLGNVVRVAYLLIDRLNPELDENTRRFMTAKLRQATWGIDENTRFYLAKKTYK